MTKIISIAGTALAALAVWAAAGHSTTSQVRPIHETVVYSSIQPANWDLYVFDRPGATPRRLTMDPGLDYNPAISPDGRWIVFTSERSGSPDLYALDLQNPAVHKTAHEKPCDGRRGGFFPRWTSIALRQHGEWQSRHQRDAVCARGSRLRRQARPQT